MSKKSAFAYPKFRQAKFAARAYSRRFFIKVANTLIDGISPARCAMCLTPGSWLCKNCIDTQMPTEPFLAALPQPELNGIISIDNYKQEWLKRGISWLKFKGIRDIAPVFGAILAEQVKQVLPQDMRKHSVLVPVPLHKRRENVRGYNQAEEIAMALADYLDVPVVNLVKRSKNTIPQTLLPKNLREENLEEAFELDPRYLANGLDSGMTDEKTICLIVDDVTTTGVTLAEVAKVLKPIPFRSYWGVTLARGK